MKNYFPIFLNSIEAITIAQIPAEKSATGPAYRTPSIPMNLGKIQASRIETFGNYVCFVQLGGENVIDEQTSEEQSIIKCQEQNELAIEVIGQTVQQ